MVKDLSYETAAVVIDSWEQVRLNPNFENELGAKLFQELFRRSPDVKLLFGFSKDFNVETQPYEKLLQNKKFVQHGAFMVQMLDATLNMLGPDLELLSEVLQELGSKHARYGVKPNMYKVMGESLFATLEQILGSENFTPYVKDAWTEVFFKFSADMMDSK